MREIKHLRQNKATSSDLLREDGVEAANYQNLANLTLDNLNTAYFQGYSPEEVKNIFIQKLTQWQDKHNLSLSETDAV